MKGQLIAFVTLLLLFWIFVANLWTLQQNRIKIVMKTDYPKFFFVETSGSTTLNPRQVCAVESTARHHRLSNVTVIMSSLDVSEQTIELFRTLPNIRIVAKTLDDIFSNTSLEEWYKKGDWKKSEYRISHLSDAIRPLLLWNHGGIYLDLDIVMLKSLYNLRRNFLFRENDNIVGSAILAFEPKHPIISAYISGVKKYYKPKCFACIGPTLITRLATSFCKTKSARDLSTRNCSVAVYPPVSAFPISWSNWKDYFDRNKTDAVLRAVEDSNLIHVWNKLSKMSPLSLNSGCAYEMIMRQHCPSVYKYVSLNRLKF